MTRFSPDSASGVLPFPEHWMRDVEHAPSANAEGDRKDDVAELRKAAKAATNKREAAELNWLADLYEHEDKLHAQTVKDLKGIYRGTVAELRKLARSGDVSVRAALLRGNETQLLAILEASGLRQGELAWQAGLDEGVALARQWETLNGLSPAFTSPDLEAFIAYDAAVKKAKGLYRDAVAAPSLEVMREGLQGALKMERLPDAADRIARRLGVTQSQAMTEARTRAAMFDRAVTDETAARHGVQAYVYRGPLDGITRSFCRACLRMHNLYWPRDMVARLTNGQTPTSPLFTCGGYNCRHLWIPVTEESIEDRGLKRATLADVRAVNGAALKTKRKRKR
jgi:hypothetical protein